MSERQDVYDATFGDVYETEPDQKDIDSDMKKVGVQSSTKSKT